MTSDLTKAREAMYRRGMPMGAIDEIEALILAHLDAREQAPFQTEEELKRAYNLSIKDPSPPAETAGDDPFETTQEIRDALKSVFQTTETAAKALGYSTGATQVSAFLRDYDRITAALRSETAARERAERERDDIAQELNRAESIRYIHRDRASKAEAELSRIRKAVEGALIELRNLRKDVGMGTPDRTILVLLDHTIAFLTSALEPETQFARPAGETIPSAQGGAEEAAAMTGQPPVAAASTIVEDVPAQRAYCPSCLGWTCPECAPAPSPAAEAMANALEEADRAVEASYRQGIAEYQHHEGEQARCDDLIRAWRKQRNAALAAYRAQKGWADPLDKRQS